MALEIDILELGTAIVNRIPDSEIRPELLKRGNASIIPLNGPRSGSSSKQNGENVLS